MDSGFVSQQVRDGFPSMQMVRTGRAIRLAGRITFICLVVSIVAMLFVPWQQTARGIGTVLALNPQERPQPVLCPADGLITYTEKGIREGSYVEKDQLVLRITPFATGEISENANQIRNTENALLSQKALYAVAQSNVESQKSSGRSLLTSLEQAVEASRQKWEQAKKEVAKLQAELADKKNQLRIAEDVYPAGIISREELFSKRQMVDAQYQETLKAENAAEEAYALLSSKKEELLSKTQDIYIKNAEAEQKMLAEEQKIQSLEKSLSELRVKGQSLAAGDVRAPRSGFIQQWNANEGSEAVKKGDALFVLVPDTDELAVEMQVSGNDMPLIQEGDRVRLQFEGWPAVQFVGWPSVAVGTFGGKVNRVFPTDDGKGNFRVLVTPDNHFDREDGWPDDRYLRQGVRANGWVLLKQVPLGYEIWRQLNGFPPVVSDQEPGKPKKEDKGTKVKLPKL